METRIFLKIIATILLFVVLSTIANADPNNPLDIDFPISIWDFDIATILATLNDRFYIPEPGGCDIATLCLNMVANILYDVGVNIFSALIVGGGVPIMLIGTFFQLFLFNTWGVFQGHLFLVLTGALLTALLLGSFVLWIVDQIKSSIPFLRG